MLFRKMLRDMKLNKMQFISIFIMSFLGVFVYAGIGGEWHGIQKELDRYYTETNFGDVWLNGENFSENDRNGVLSVDGVYEAELRCETYAVGDFGNKPSILLTYVDEYDISKFVVADGEPYSEDTDGIWLDALFAEAKGLSVGDKIKMYAFGTTIEKTVVGTVYSPEHILFTGDGDMLPDHYKLGYGYIPSDYFPNNIGITYNSMVIKTDRTDFAQLESEISDVLDGEYSVFTPRKDFSSNLSIVNEVNQHKAMGNIFPIAFLSIAMLTILTTMTRIVSNQRTQIGSLKALGFKRGAILRHYVSYGFWLSLAGSIAGVIVGPYTIPLLFYPPLSEMYALISWYPAMSWTFFAMAALSVAICTFSAYFACRNVLRDTPAETLRPKAPKNVRHTAFEKTKFWHRLGFDVQWNLRDVFRRMARSLMAIVGVAGCTGLIVCAFGFRDTMSDVVNWQYGEISNYATVMTVSPLATASEIDSIEHRFTTESAMQSGIEISCSGKSEYGTLTVTDATELLRMTAVDRELMTIEKDEIALSYFMAEKLNVGVGDRVTWHILGDDEWHRAKISAIYRCPTIQGITMSESSFEALGNKYIYTPTSIYTAEPVTKLYDGIVSVQQNEKQRDSFSETIESMSVMIYILIVAAALLAVVVLYNLGILSFTEKERELATLKVVGFKSGRLRGLLFLQNIWLTAVGIVCGFPFGIWLIKFMIEFMQIDMMSNLSLWSVVRSIALPFIFSAAVNLMFSDKINHIDMVSSLKGVE